MVNGVVNNRSDGGMVTTLKQGKILSTSDDTQNDLLKEIRKGKQ